MEKNKELKNIFQKKISTKFLVKLQGTLMEYFWTCSYVKFLLGSKIECYCEEPLSNKLTK